jgi:hypothetical protein
MICFLHTSDWQLGMTRHFLSEGAQERYSQARFDAIRAMGRIAKEENCQFMLVCGDNDLRPKPRGGHDGQIPCPASCALWCLLWDGANVTSMTALLRALGHWRWRGDQLAQQ